MKTISPKLTVDRIAKLTLDAIMGETPYLSSPEEAEAFAILQRDVRRAPPGAIIEPVREVDWLGPVAVKESEAASDCGANAPGGGGFQQGNTCAGDGSGKDDTPEARHARRKDRIDRVRRAQLELMRKARLGGFTFDVAEGDQPESGYAVAPAKDTERVLGPVGGVESQDLVDYALENLDLLEKPGAHLGVWVYNGQVVADVSVVTEDADEALNLAINGNQLAYYDLGAKREINTWREAEIRGLAVSEELSAAYERATASLSAKNPGQADGGTAGGDTGDAGPGHESDSAGSFGGDRADQSGDVGGGREATHRDVKLYHFSDRNSDGDLLLANAGRGQAGSERQYLSEGSRALYFYLPGAEVEDRFAGKPLRQIRLPEARAIDIYSDEFKRVMGNSKWRLPEIRDAVQAAGYDLLIDSKRGIAEYYKDVPARHARWLATKTRLESVGRRG